jgi:molybdate transport system ATP-binding protein
LITGENAKGYGQDLSSLVTKGSGESIWDIKANPIFDNDRFVSKSHTLEQMILSGFFDSIGLYVQPTSTHIKLVSNGWI